MKNETGYRGVRKSKDNWRAKPYFARVKLGEREIYTNRCATAVGAAIAYDALAFTLHGSKAVLNFPSGRAALAQSEEKKEKREG